MVTLFINITWIGVDAQQNLSVSGDVISDLGHRCGCTNVFSINWTSATNVTLAAVIGAYAKTQMETTTGTTLVNPTFVFIGLAIGVQSYAPTPLAAAEAFPAFTGSSFSSHNPASVWLNKIVIPDAVVAKNINIVKALAPTVPGGTSTNSSGTFKYSYSHGLTIFTRQDYSVNSTNLTTYTTGSFGFTAGLTYSSGSQSAQISWCTDTTGGTTAFSTTSSNGGWSNYLTGTKLFQIPMATTLSGGEYFFAHRHSSTNAVTGASTITLMLFSNAHIGFPTAGSTYGTITSSGAIGAFGFGVMTGVTSTTTMAISAATVNASANNWYMNFTNG